MTLDQTKTLIAGVLKGWFRNKKTLDGFSQINNELYFNGNKVNGAGKDGVDGANGINGTDGFSPTISSSKSNGVLTLTITDKNGTRTETLTDGVNGTNGKDGNTPTIEIGTVETISSDKSASAEIEETETGIKINLKIPKGETGPKGDTGATGATGPAGSSSSFDPSVLNDYATKTYVDEKFNQSSQSQEPEVQEIESNSYDYIYDEASWNASFANGALKKYYTKYPDEDRYNQQEHRWAWPDGDKVNGEWPDYCVQCWEGAVNSNGAKFPWICPNFDTDVNAKIIFQYEGKEDVQPWGENIFGIGRKADGTDRLWGIASVAEEFQDKGFLIPENEENGDSSWSGRKGDNNFDINKFKMILVKQPTQPLSNEEIEALRNLLRNN